MINSSAIDFFSLFFEQLWYFLTNAKVPLTNLPLAALIFGPFALGVLFAVLDKLLGFGMPSVISSIRSIRSSSVRDSVSEDRKDFYRAGAEYYRNKK